MLTNLDGDLACSSPNGSGVIYRSPESEGTKQGDEGRDRLISVQVAPRFVVFTTRDTPRMDSPWQIHAWDRTQPEKPSWEIGRSPEGSEIHGWIWEQVRGDMALWVQEGVGGDLSDVMLYSLATREVRVLHHGASYRASFITDDVVAWLAPDPNQRSRVLLKGTSISTGAPWQPPPQIADSDLRFFGYRVDNGDFALPLNESKGEDDDRFGVLVWRTGWEAPVRLREGLIGPLNLDTAVLSQGYFAYLDLDQVRLKSRIQVLNLSTGIEYTIYGGAAQVTVAGDSLRLFRNDPDQGPLAVTVPLSTFSDTTC